MEKKKKMNRGNNRGEKEDFDSRLSASVTKDSSISLLRVLSVLIIFVVGMVIGLASSSHIDRYFFQSEEFYPTRITKFDGENCTILISKCEKEDCLSMKSFITPKNLTHSMSDEELFWRASLVPKQDEYPFDRVPKVAFLFLTRGPLPLLPLWEKFFRGENKNKYSIYVHTEPGYVLNVTNSSPFFGRQIPTQVPFFLFFEKTFLICLFSCESCRLWIIVISEVKNTFYCLSFHYRQVCLN